MEVRQQDNSSDIRAFGAAAPGECIVVAAGGRAPSHGRTAIACDREALLLRNVGLLWLTLGSVITAVGIIEGQGFRLSVGLWLGAACYAAYRLCNVHATIAPTDKGHAALIPDAQWQRIMGEIEARRARPRKVRDLVPRTSSLKQYRARFAWQHQQGRLSDAGLRHRLATMDALVAALDPARSSLGASRNAGLLT